MGNLFVWYWNIKLIYYYHYFNTDRLEGNYLQIFVKKSIVTSLKKMENLLGVPFFNELACNERVRHLKSKLAKSDRLCQV